MTYLTEHVLTTVPTFDARPGASMELVTEKINVV